jgi:hypothetical protein
MAHDSRFRPHAEPLPDRLTPAALPLYASTGVVGTEDGGSPVVKLVNPAGTTDVQAYAPAFRGGVRVAVGDINGDGTPDLVTAAGPGGGPHLKVFDGKTGAEVRSFFAYDPAFRGGVEIATGDVNRDGYADLITGAGPGGGAHVKVFSGKDGSELKSFYAFDPTFRGGVFVASGDLNRDGYDDIIAGMGAGGTPTVRVTDGRTNSPLTEFAVFESRFGGGVRVASGDLNGDGVDDLIAAAGPGGGPRVRALDMKNGAVLSDRFVADPSFRGGVRVGTLTESGNGEVEVFARTRSGDTVSAVGYTPTSGGNLFDQKLWVGDGSPPANFLFTSYTPIPPLSGTAQPLGTIEGTVGSVASDGKSMTLLRGNGSAVTLSLTGDPKLPDGQIYIEGGVPAAQYTVGDLPGTLADVRAGRWVRVRVARAGDLTRNSFQAVRVTVL